MKNVLAELHELINDLEDQGLMSEASTLQEVFVKVAMEGDMEGDMEDDMEGDMEDDDLANDVKGLLSSHSPAEVLAEIARQMDMPEESETSQFAFETESDEVDPMRKEVVEKYHNLNEMWNKSGGKEGMDHNRATLEARKEFFGNPPIGLDEIINNRPYPMGFKPKPYDPTASMIAEHKPGYHD